MAFKKKTYGDVFRNRTAEVRYSGQISLQQVASKFGIRKNTLLERQKIYKINGDDARTSDMVPEFDPIPNQPARTDEKTESSQWG